MDSATANPPIKSLSDCYKYYDIPYNCIIDEINLIISNKGYINEISEDGLFAAQKEKEYLKFGEIWVEFLNIFKTPFCYDVFYPLYSKMQTKYEDICFDFVKEFYSEFRSISGCSAITAQSLIDHIVWCARCKNIKFSQLAFNDCDFEILSFFNPKAALNNFDYSPKIAIFKTTLTEVDGESCFVHHDLTADTLISIDIINCRTHNLNILQCEHCHKYFVQNHRNNTKYCGKCKSLPDKERRNDEFENLYNKVRARLRAKNRSMTDDRKDKYLNGNFYRWTVEVTKQKKIYKQNNDLEGFKAYIENAEKDIRKF